MLYPTAVSKSSSPTHSQLTPRIAVIGAGTMGRAIIGGLVRTQITSTAHVLVTDRSELRGEAIARELGVTHAENNTDAVRQADIVILCVKPHDVVSVLQEIVTSDAFAHHPIVMSIAAGVRIATIEQLLDKDVPVIRAMPNTASIIGHGMTAISRGTSASDSDLEVAKDIFNTLGRCLVLEERYLDAVTALSASGPAFVYVILEAFADGGVQCGLPRSVAIELASQMMLGAAAMVLETDQHPAALKDAVTTPGGCTIAGLLTLEDGRIRSVLARTIERTAHVASGLGQ